MNSQMVTLIRRLRVQAPDGPNLLDDAADALLSLDATQDRLIGSNAKLRDKLGELAKECTECDGTGLVTVAQTLEAVDAGSAGDVQQECGQCHDIRVLLV